MNILCLFCGLEDVFTQSSATLIKSIALLIEMKSYFNEQKHVNITKLYFTAIILCFNNFMNMSKTVRKKNFIYLCF